MNSANKKKVMPTLTVRMKVGVGFSVTVYGNQFVIYTCTILRLPVKYLKLYTEKKCSGLTFETRSVPLNMRTKCPSLSKILYVSSRDKIVRKMKILFARSYMSYETSLYPKCARD